MSNFVPGILRGSDLELGMRLIFGPDIGKLEDSEKKAEKRFRATTSCPDHLEKTRVLLLRSKEGVGARDTSHEIDLADTDSRAHKVEDVRVQRLPVAAQATRTFSTHVLKDSPETSIIDALVTPVDFSVSPPTGQSGLARTCIQSTSLSSEGGVESLVRVPAAFTAAIFAQQSRTVEVVLPPVPTRTLRTQDSLGEAVEEVVISQAAMRKAIDSALPKPVIVSSEPPVVEELRTQGGDHVSASESEDRDELFFRTDTVALRETAKDIRRQQALAILARASGASNTEDLPETRAPSYGPTGQAQPEAALRALVEVSALAPARIDLPVKVSSAIAEVGAASTALPAPVIDTVIPVHAVTRLPTPHPLLASTFRPKDVIIKDSDTALSRIERINVAHFNRRLQVCNLLGSGAYGAVYHVRCHSTYTLRGSGASVSSVYNVALKVFFNRDGISRRAIEYETALLHRISHPSILRVHSSCSECGYMLMEMPSNKNLADATIRGLIPREGLKPITAHLAFILEYLRLKRVAHWDFRPRNIAVNVEQEGYPVTLLDFGLSEEVPFGREYHVPRGPVCCRPPEMYAYSFDGTSGYDAFSAHWYALGVLLYRVAYRAYPFVNDTFTEVEARWKADNTPTLIDRGLSEEDIDQYILGISHTPRAPSPAHADPDLDDLIRQLMNPDPKRRADFVKIRQHRWLFGVNWRGLEHAFTEVAAAHSADSVH